MGIANYVFRRGRLYVWRRLYRGQAVQVPLSTADPFEAKRLAGAAIRASTLGWNLLDRGEAELSTVRDAIRAAVKHERVAMDYEAAGGNPATFPGVSAFYFFFGLTAPDDEPERPKRDAQGPDITDAAKTPIRPPVSSASRPVPATTPAQTRETPPQSAAQSVPEASPRPRKPRPAAPAGFSARIADVVTRMSATHARTGRANAKTLTQMRVIADLFCEITGLDDVRDVRQTHLAKFVATLDRLPPAYRRSAAERDKPIMAIIAEAEASGVKCGLSVATVNRNLVHLGKVLKAAQAEGLRIDPSVNPSLLRRFSKRAAKDDRDPFTPDEVRQIFGAPVWTGCKSARRRRKPGDVIVKDWLYWVPLIAAYSGARREEICGLETADIEDEDGIPIFRIRVNARRGIKNAQSERRVPIHSHLIELGFLDYVRDQRERKRAHLFHDLKRKSAESQIGDSIDYMWRNIQADRLGPQPRKTFHSLRHYAVQGLRAESDVEKHIRAELFGHLVGDIEDDRYGGRAPVATLRAAVEALPRVF